MSLIAKLSQIRMHAPGAFARALRERPKADPAQLSGNLMIIACDHPARGALGAGGGEQAMASREQLLDRCIQALSREGVDGFLGTADLIEDLALLGALDNKLVFGSMNRGGLQGAQLKLTTALLVTTRVAWWTLISTAAKCCCEWTTTIPPRCAP